MKKQENKALRQLAKEALKSDDVCKDWKNKILEAAPSLIDKGLDVGKWYKREGEKSIFKITSEIEVSLKYKGYGLDVNSKWFSEDSKGYIFYNKNYILATEQDVFEALKKEAIKRGFKVGVVVNHICSGTGVIGDSFDCEYIILKDMFYFNNILVYKKGKWATISETITKEEAEKQLGKTII